MPKASKTKPIQMPPRAWEILSKYLRDDTELSGLGDYLAKVKGHLVGSLQRNQDISERVSRRKNQRLTRAEAEWVMGDVDILAFFSGRVIKDLLQESFQEILSHLPWIIVGLGEEERQMCLKMYEEEVRSAKNYVGEVLEKRLDKWEASMKSGFDCKAADIPKLVVKFAEVLCEEVDQLEGFWKSNYQNGLDLLNRAGVDTSNLLETELPPGFQEPRAFSVVTAISDPDLGKHASSVVRKALRDIKNSEADFPLVGEIAPSCLLVRDLPTVCSASAYTRDRQFIVISIPSPTVLALEKDNCLRDPDRHLAHLTAHEVGHMLWALLSKKNHRVWRKAYLKSARQIARGDLEPPTAQYISVRCEEEGFCEIFATLFWDAEYEHLSDLQETVREILSGT